MKRFFAFLLISLLFFVGAPSTMSVAHAEGTTYAVSGFERAKNSIESILSDFVESGVTRKERAYRVAGSVSERHAAEYIKSQLDNLTNFKPVNNSSTVDGIEEFEFVSNVDSIGYTSQNIVYRKDSSASGGKKVIIAAHYDTTFVADTRKEDRGVGVGIVSDGVNDNAASVATILSLASSLDKVEDLGFGIELIFFGAGSNDYAGARYHSRGMSDEEASNTLLFINLDRIALGDYTYMYVNEYVSSQQRYYFDILKDYDFKEFKHENIVDFYQESPNGLNYSHVGLESDHAIFMARKINVLNFFSGNYENFLTAGQNESNKDDNITFTENDTLEYIKENRANYLDNLAHIQLAIDTLLKDGNFLSQMLKNNGANAFETAYMNEKLPAFITAMLLIVFIFIYYLTYLQLQKKSRERASGKDVEHIVIRIVENLGEDDEVLSNAIDQKIKRDTQDKNKKEGDDEKDKDKEE